MKLTWRDSLPQTDSLTCIVSLDVQDVDLSLAALRAFCVMMMMGTLWICCGLLMISNHDVNLFPQFCRSLTADQQLTGSQACFCRRLLSQLGSLSAGGHSLLMPRVSQTSFVRGSRGSLFACFQTEARPRRTPRAPQMQLGRFSMGTPAANVQMTSCFPRESRVSSPTQSCVPGLGVKGHGKEPNTWEQWELDPVMVITANIVFFMTSEVWISWCGKSH